LARNNVLRMMLLISIVWVLIIGESYLFFFVVRLTGPNIHESLPSAVVKILSTIGLAGVWVAVMFAFENLLFRRTGIKENPAA
jgi:hypothetical protein